MLSGFCCKQLLISSSSRCFRSFLHSSIDLIIIIIISPKVLENTNILTRTLRHTNNGILLILLHLSLSLIILVLLCVQNRSHTWRSWVWTATACCFRFRRMSRRARRKPLSMPPPSRTRAPSRWVCVRVCVRGVCVVCVSACVRVSKCAWFSMRASVYVCALVNE